MINQLRRLLEEAWKADLNYIPPNKEVELRTMAPHEVIEMEIKEADRSRVLVRLSFLLK